MPSMDEALLEKSILFQGMTEDERKACLDALQAHEKAYKKGTPILNAGDVTKEMGLVLSGSVTVESNDVWGNCTILAHIGPGQFFAETYALLPNTVMLVDVIANDNCRILFLQIGKVLSTNTPASWPQKLFQNLLLISVHKNLALSGRSLHTAPKSARGRILAYLHSVALQKHAQEFDIPFNRQQLADYLNLERTNMSKELTRMRIDGLIECQRSHFKLLSKGVEA